ncbi:MAG: hypothetical protein HQK96_14330 [Nitrospirae bacterium]|nr:hypothetical protein [Nitrospirota bacterium]
MPRLDQLKVPKSAAVNPFRLDTFGEHAGLAERKTTLTFSLTKPDHFEHDPIISEPVAPPALDASNETIIVDLSASNIHLDGLFSNVDSSVDSHATANIHSNVLSSVDSHVISNAHSSVDSNVAKRKQSSSVDSNVLCNAKRNVLCNVHSSADSHAHSHVPIPFNLKNFISHLPKSEFNTLAVIMRLICDTGTLSTYEIMQTRDIADPQGKTRQLVFEETGKLIKKGLVYKDKEKSKRGNNGHTVFGCSQEIKSLWISEFLQLGSNAHSSADSNVLSNVESNAKMEEEVYLDIKENSSSVLNEFLGIERSDFAWLDEQRIKQIIKFGNCSVEDLKDVLNKVRFAKQTGEYEKGWKVQSEPNFVMNSIKETGTIYTPKGYVSPKVKLMQEELERKRVEVEQIKKLQEEAQELDFELWLNKLTKDELEAIYKSSDDLRGQVAKMNINSKFQRPALKEYFIENK